MGWYISRLHDDVLLNDGWTGRDARAYSGFLHAAKSYADRVMPTLIPDNLGAFDMKGDEPGTIDAYEPFVGEVDCDGRKSARCLHASRRLSAKGREFEWRFRLYLYRGDMDMLDEYERDIDMYFDTHRCSYRTLAFGLVTPLAYRAVTGDRTYAAVGHNVTYDGFIKDC